MNSNQNLMIQRENIRYLEYDSDRIKNNLDRIQNIMSYESDLEEMLLVYPKGNKIYVLDDEKEYLISSRETQNDNIKHLTYGSKNLGIISIFTFNGLLYDSSIFQEHSTEYNDDVLTDYIRTFETFTDKEIFTDIPLTKSVQCFYLRRYFIEVGILEERK